MLTRSKSEIINEARYIAEAREYLLSLEGVTFEMLDKQLNAWRDKKPRDIPGLFRAFLEHAKNRQGMPNSIGDVGRLKEVLFGFDPYRTSLRYSSWEDVFEAVLVSGYRPPGRMAKANKLNYWVIYCKTIVSVAKFMSAFKGIEEFNSFVDGFQTNQYSRLALPLLLEEEIFGFGFALACDFLKENGYPQFIKPDTHINYIAHELGVTKATSNYKIFRDVIAYCERVGALPYEVDKLFWLVGSGSFYLSGFQAKSSRSDFVKRVKERDV